MAGVVARCAGPAPVTSPSAAGVVVAPTASSTAEPTASSRSDSTAPATSAAVSSPSASPVPTPPASTAPSAVTSAAPSIVPSPSGPTSQHDPDLEALLPGTFHGVTLAKLSFSGSEKYPVSIVGSGWAEALASVGKTAADVSFASATTSKLHIAFQAYRVKGADASIWSPILVEAFMRSPTHPPVSQITIAGRQVTKVGTSPSTYALASGDVLFIIQTNDDSLVADAVASLP